MKIWFQMTYALVVMVAQAALASLEELYHDLEEDSSSFLAVVNPSKTIETATSSAAVEPLRVPLTRTYTGGQGSNWRTSAYVGDLFLGSPRMQRLRVSFDTASGQVIVPSSRCKSQACQEHQRYAAGASASARDVNADGSQVRLLPGSLMVRRDAITVGVSSIDHGSGNAYGDLVMDQLCIGGPHHCTELGLVAVTNMSDVPFRAMVQDGIVGLGMSKLAANPAFHPLSSFQGNASKSFSLWLGAEHGELSMGSIDPHKLLSRSAQSLDWIPVLSPEEGYWQFTVNGLKIGNKTIACHSGGSCRAVIDTSAAGVGFPPEMYQPLLKAISPQACEGPPITLEVQVDGTSSLLLHLESKEYRDTSCEPMLVATDLPESFKDVIVLGQPFLRKYFTSFDWGTRRLGFGLSDPQAVPSFSNGISANATEAGTHSLLSTKEAEELEAQLGEDWRAKAMLTSSEAAFHQTNILAALLLQVLIMQVAMVMVFISFGRNQEPLTGRAAAARLNAWIQDWFGLKIYRNNHLTSWLLAVRRVPPQEAECVICLGVRDEEARHGCGCEPTWCELQCGHVFHQECIAEWLVKVQRCPVCRSHIYDGKYPPENNEHP